MNTPRYLVAKYVSDLQRQEPRNIGIVVWSADACAARFIGEQQPGSGDINARFVPTSWLKNPSAYRQWVSFWQSEINSESINLPGKAEPVPRYQEEFCKALQYGNKGHFQLVDGGYLLEHIDAGNIRATVDQLFNALVQEVHEEEQHDQTLVEAVASILERSRLRLDDNFKDGYEIECYSSGEEYPIKFSHAYLVKGKAKQLFQRVPLPKQPTNLIRNVQSAAFMYQSVVKDASFQPQQVHSLILAGPEMESERHVSRGLAILRSHSNVINLWDEQRSLEQLAKIPQLSRG